MKIIKSFKAEVIRLRSLRTLYRRIKRFIVWFPVIWYDEDWEFDYILKILQFKISRVRKSIEKARIITDWKSVSREMKVAEDLINRQISDYYDDLREKIEGEEKKGNCSCPEEVYTTVPCENGNLLVVFNYCKFCAKHNSRWFKESQKKKKEDWNYLFQHMRDNMHTWWD